MGLKRRRGFSRSASIFTCDIDTKILFAPLSVLAAIVNRPSVSFGIVRAFTSPEVLATGWLAHLRAAGGGAEFMTPDQYYEPKPEAEKSFAEIGKRGVVAQSRERVVADRESQ